MSRNLPKNFFWQKMLKNKPKIGYTRWKTPNFQTERDVYAAWRVHVYTLHVRKSALIIKTYKHVCIKQSCWCPGILRDRRRVLSRRVLSQMVSRGRTLITVSYNENRFFSSSMVELQLFETVILKRSRFVHAEQIWVESTKIFAMLWCD